MAVAPATLAAQRSGIIAGIVVDETNNPIADADVIASAENARARTDSAGRFIIRNLQAGQYHLRVQRIGYFATRLSVDLGHAGRADVHAELKVRPAMLDSVFVVADGRCPDRALSGFFCRRRAGKGVYLTDDDIFDRNAREIGDIFRGVPGFKIELRPSIWGPLPIPLAVGGSRCLNALVNGRPASVTNQLPRYADQMLAVEIYASPADVPPEYQQYAWGAQGRQTQMFASHVGSTDRCALANYWTRFD